MSHLVAVTFLKTEKHRFNFSQFEIANLVVESAMAVGDVNYVAATIKKVGYSIAISMLIVRMKTANYASIGTLARSIQATRNVMQWKRPW
jgi:hypothetical protein